MLNGSSNKCNMARYNFVWLPFHHAISMHSFCDIYTVFNTVIMVDLQKGMTQSLSIKNATLDGLKMILGAIYFAEFVSYFRQPSCFRGVTSHRKKSVISPPAKQPPSLLDHSWSSWSVLGQPRILRQWSIEISPLHLRLFYQWPTRPVLIQHLLGFSSS